MRMIAAAMALTLSTLPIPAKAQERVETLRAQVAEYEALVARLEAQEAVENIQAAFGYYIDKGLWDRAAALFAADGSYEYGQGGVYIGTDRIRQALALTAPQGLAPGRLNETMQLQPYVSVAEDGRSAKARWRSIQMLTTAEGQGRWGAGLHENEYAVGVDGKWRITRLHGYVTFLSGYDKAWTADDYPMAGPSTTLPPDRPPTEVYQSLPGNYLPPYHYRNPVTGRSGELAR